jgi:hypothetical protein
VLLQIGYDDLRKLNGCICQLSGRTWDGGCQGWGKVVVLEEVVDDEGIVVSSDGRGRGGRRRWVVEAEATAVNDEEEMNAMGPTCWCCF